MELEEYNYEIYYRPGSQNVIPDYLSRLLQQLPDNQVQDEDKFEARVFHVQKGDQMSIMRETQRRDLVIAQAVEQLEMGKVSRGQLRRVNPHLNMKQGVLRFDGLLFEKLSKNRC